ncbi:hypothetical protein Godav_019057 [Gossypium davidsonii]|uniref:Uncharacterized protein n=2 Tax=Gossypium TaxID=3633 RepID=A0A7J9KG85_9ROSI|nr:hypothetical protein [Gossypium davidsonii]MBA0845457.1 hypothetical protein [Gossypium armourianum]MBA0845458.1 hypothetical protein [Gossypium armourianum]
MQMLKTLVPVPRSMCIFVFSSGMVGKA